MSRQATTLVLLGALLLIVVGVIVYMLRPAMSASLVPQESARAPRESSPARIESPPGETRTAPLAEAPVPPVAPAEDLRAEGARRGWQLPLGKGWWLDTLLNPGGVDPEGGELARLQEQLLTHGDGLLALRQKRKQRLDAYCQERIAAGLAVEDNAHDFPADGREHEWITVHTLAEPNRTLRVDVGPGDDAQLDQCDRQIAGAWCEAVADMRQRFAALKRQ